MVHGLTQPHAPGSTVEAPTSLSSQNMGLSVALHLETVKAFTYYGMLHLLFFGCTGESPGDVQKA